MKCRFCQCPLEIEFIDLGTAPPSNAFLSADQLSQSETWLPLKLFVCQSCLLVQVDAYQKPESVFDADYAYFSSYSSSWLEHCRQFADQMVDQYGAEHLSPTVEIASNDGYLLQYFQAHGVRTLGIEPAANAAAVASDKGIETKNAFFNRQTAAHLAASGLKARLLIGNNVLAHVHDLNDFVGALPLILAPEGIITMEFPHLQQLIEGNQFDTIYQEHYSYFSFHTVRRVFESHDMTIVDVQQLATHGGSLRIYAQKTAFAAAVSPRVEALLEQERNAGLLDPNTYRNFGRQAVATAHEFLALLLHLRKQGKSIAGYGAAAKGNTLLNFCGVRAHLIDFIVDASPHKQGKYTPGARIPVVDESRLQRDKPDYIVLLPWNIRDEIMAQLRYIGDWGGRFILPIPKPTIIDPPLIST